MAKTRFSLGNFLLRLLLAVLVVCATYNPIEPYSFYHWAIAPALADFSQITVLHGFVGVILLIAWVIFIRATTRSLGFLGTLLAAAFFTMLIWLVIDQGWIALDEGNQTLTWLIIAGLSGILATGMSWSHVRRRLSGQMDVDEVDEG